MPTAKAECPDCHVPLQPIKLLDATEPGFTLAGVAHIELGYAAADAKPSPLMRQIPRLGVVKGLICPECGRIVLYGHKAD
jgi:hypothetical protein